MKKLILFTTLVLALSLSTMAEKKEIYTRFHSTKKTSHTQVHRAPMHLPINVSYDSENLVVEVKNDDMIEAEVFVYDVDGSRVYYSPVLNTTFPLTQPGNYTIIIMGDDWYGEGTIVI